MNSSLPVIPTKAGISRIAPPARPEGDASLCRHDGRGPNRRSSGGYGAALALVLAACSSQPDAPGAVTADEARQLDDAAAMLDANSVDGNAVTRNESDQ